MEGGGFPLHRHHRLHDPFLPETLRRAGRHASPCFYFRYFFLVSPSRPVEAKEWQAMVGLARFLNRLSLNARPTRRRDTRCSMARTSTPDSACPAGRMESPQSTVPGSSPANSAPPQSTAVAPTETESPPLGQARSRTTSRSDPGFDQPMDEVIGALWKWTGGGNVGKRGGRNSKFPGLPPFPGSSGRCWGWRRGCSVKVRNDLGRCLPSLRERCRAPD